jgi:hypothetical protein
MRMHAVVLTAASRCERMKVRTRVDTQLGKWWTEPSVFAKEIWGTFLCAFYAKELGFRV